MKHGGTPGAAWRSSDRVLEPDARVGGREVEPFFVQRVLSGDAEACGHERNYLDWEGCPMPPL